MNIFFEKIAEDMVEFSKEVLKGYYQEKQLRDRVEAYLSKKKFENGIFSIQNEYDYQGLVIYIRNTWPQKFENYLKISGDKRKAAREQMLAEAFECARPKGTGACNQVRIILNFIFELYYEAYRGNSTQGERLLAAEIEEKMSEDTNTVLNKINEVSNRIEKGNSSHRERRKWNFEEYRFSQQNIVLNCAIFPWFSGSKRYREVFPKLFIYPKLKDRGNDFSYNNLLEDTDQHIAILGEAGAGKSTLLRYIFLCEKLEEVTCIYLTAKDAFNNKAILRKINDASSAKKSLVFIDGIDEAIQKNPQKYTEFIGKLRNYYNCRFWISCRTDYYRQFYNEETMFTKRDVEIQPWDDNIEAERFINTYAEIVEKPFLPSVIEKLTTNSDEIKNMKTNPFQLALLVFLSENEEDISIFDVYDLYDKFMEQWYKREHNRGTSEDSFDSIICSLSKAARKIYIGESWKLDNIAITNSAAKNLLVTTEVNARNEIYAKDFYHRSIAAFLIAKKIYTAFEKGDFIAAKSLLGYKLKDDITNFIGAKIASASDDIRMVLKTNLIRMYNKSSNSKLSVREQLIYFISRLGVDVTDFLKQIVSEKPNNPIMRLTLAYGCVLSNDLQLREYALEYAKSISKGSIDALTNRGWTVVYFGDVNDKNPYNYLDDEKRPWSKARAARIKRFTREKPRLKDVRFWLFDIPLFRNFLEDRNWNNLSVEELTILKSLNISSNYFNANEKAFLCTEKGLLIEEYEKQLKKQAVN